ncbi:hypothetical protein DSO57_1016270 [Entomophthora muscae]|uniref:Uncharacterized protein n=1 Tax=Entomophthora muscae TaxID=34485 RepID=A0ACC2TSG5_9FUNG|nr:hypothetical protein DSO57_1016270 [Entomophthora muscae]
MLSPNAKTFSSKTTTLPAPPPGTEPRPGGGFCLTSEEIFRRRTNNLCSYCGSKDHLLALYPLSKQSNTVTSSTSLNSLMSKNSSISPTVLVTIHGPLGKVKVLALLDTVLMQNLLKRTWKTPSDSLFLDHWMSRLETLLTLTLPLSLSQFLLTLRALHSA